MFAKAVFRQSAAVLIQNTRDYLGMETRRDNTLGRGRPGKKTGMDDIRPSLSECLVSFVRSEIFGGVATDQPGEPGQYRGDDEFDYSKHS